VPDFTLTEQQRRAATHPLHRFLRVQAGPGTGKTALLQARFAHLVREAGCPPETVLCLTFGQKAAAALRHRLFATGIAGRAREGLWVHTFHQFALRVLQESALEAGTALEPHLLAEDEARRLMEAETAAYLEEIADTPADFRDYVVEHPADLAALALATREALTRVGARPEALLARTREALAGDADRDETAAVAAQSLELAGHLPPLLARYEARLAAEGAHDYGALLIAAVALLEARPALADALRERFRAVLLDEFQDTDPLQWRLVGLVARPGLANVTVVGDAKQSIYGWRGAGGALELPANAETLPLQDNHRSHQEILDVAEAVIKASPVYADEPALRAARLGAAGGALVEAALYRAPEGDEQAEAEGIAARIADLHAGRAAPTPALPFRQVAILMRSIAPARVEPIEQALRRRGIPFAVSGGQGLLTRPEVQDARALLALAHDPHDAAALVRCLASPLLRWSQGRIAALFEAARAEGRAPFDLLGAPPGGLPPDEARAAEAFRALVAAWHARLPGATPAEALADLLERSGMGLVLARGLLEAERIRDNLERLLHLAAAFPQAHPGTTAGDFLARLDEGALGGLRVAEEPPDPLGDAVSIMTVHQAKGLEFGAVFVPGLRRGRFPARGAAFPPPWRVHPAEGFGLRGTSVYAAIESREAERQALEERRLFYVALTRAERRVFLSAVLTRTGQGAVAPFLDELEGHPAVQAAPPAPPDPTPVAAAEAPPARDLAAELERLDRVREALARERPTAEAASAPGLAAEPPPAGLAGYVLRWAAHLRDRPMAEETPPVALRGLVSQRRLPGGETEIVCACDDPGRLRRGERVVVHDPEGAPRGEGRVSAVSGAALVLRLRAPVVADALGRVAPPPDDTAAAGLAALARLEVRGAEGPWVPWLLERPAPEPPPAAPLVPGPATAGLNGSQAETVARVLAGERLVLLHGPPGTGKTRTLAALASALLGRGRRVLLAAYTHQAVDQALEMVLRAGAGGGAALVRVGHPLAVRPDLHGHLAPPGPVETVRARCTAAGLVAATVRALHGPAFAGLPRFDVLILDEATQVLEPLALPLLLLAERALLAGDPHQLPPLVAGSGPGNGPDAAARRSLFQRWQAAYPAQMVALDTQYRMNDALLSFPARRFYGGALRCAGPAVAARALPLEGAPAAAGEETAGGSEGALSPAERAALLDGAQALVFLPALDAPPAGALRFPAAAGRTVAAVALLLGAGLAPEALGVIVPFRAQVAEVRRRLAGSPGAAVVVDTVDRFQGSEREVIVLGLCNAGGTVPGLLRDGRRFNVALTRARAKLVLVGDPRPPLEPGPLADFFAHLDAVGALPAAPAAEAPAPAAEDAGAAAAVAAAAAAAGWEAPVEGYVVLDEAGDETAHMAELFWPQRRAALLLPEQADARATLEALGCRVAVYGGEPPAEVLAALG